MPRNPNAKPENADSKKKQPYRKPSVTSESLTAVAALCNGSSSGGRKAATPACNSGKLKS